MRSDRCQHFSKALRITNLILHMIVSLKDGIMAAGVGFHHRLTVFEMIFYTAKLEIGMNFPLEPPKVSPEDEVWVLEPPLLSSFFGFADFDTVL